MKATQLSTITLSMLLSLNSFSQEMSSPDNQCRIQAKEVALKTYQSCIADNRSAKIDQIRQEYQEKIAELKKQYEAQILELKTSTAEATKAVETAKAAEAAKATEVLTAPIELPTTNLDEAPENVDQTTAPSKQDLQTQPTPQPKPLPSLKSAPVVTQDLQLEEPTVTLRPATKVNSKPEVKPNSKVEAIKAPAKKIAVSKSPTVKKVAKTNDVKTDAAKAQDVKTNVVKANDAKTQKVVPVVAKSRTKGQKAVKGIAKTLPVKQKAVEATPVADVATEGALMKPALADEVKQTTDKPQVSQATEVESTQQ